MTGDCIIGTAGWSRFPAPENWKDNHESKLQAFADEYPAVEVNRTFYSLPQEKTARRWRKEAGSSFVFCMKAWQAVTHTRRSPTWNRENTDQFSDELLRQFGHLRTNEAVLEAWTQIRSIAEAMDASVCLIQCPPGLPADEGGIDRAREFFRSIESGDFRIAWEPRGDWKEQPEVIGDICEEFHLMHVVDPLRNEPSWIDEDVYFRLHGLNEDPYDYRYDYSSEELKTLAGQLNEYARQTGRVYCMFNNDGMYKNARELMEMNVVDAHRTK